LEDPSCRAFESSDEEAGSGPSDLGGSRTQGAVGESSGGEETQERIGRQVGATRFGQERTRRGIEASKSVKLSERGGSVTCGPGQPGSGLRFMEWKPIAAVGIQATARRRKSR